MMDVAIEIAHFTAEYAMLRNWLFKKNKPLGHPCIDRAGVEYGVAGWMVDEENQEIIYTRCDKGGEPRQIRIKFELLEITLKRLRADINRKNDRYKYKIKIYNRSIRYGK